MGMIAVRKRPAGKSRTVSGKPRGDRANTQRSHHMRVGIRTPGRPAFVQRGDGNGEEVETHHVGVTTFGWLFPAKPAFKKPDPPSMTMGWSRSVADMSLSHTWAMR